MDEDSFVVCGEVSVLLVEELYGAELAAVEGRQRRGEPSLEAVTRGSRTVEVPASCSSAIRTTFRSCE